MSEESSNPAVEEVPKEEVSTHAEDTTPKPDGQVVQTEGIEGEEPPKMIPKERFDQVWARTKKSEARLKELEIETQREREERIRLEERLKVREEQQNQKEMSWEELENGIAEGKWSRAQAQEYKEKMTEQRLAKRLEEQERQKMSSNRILGEISQYQQLIPEVMQPGSEERTKYEREYAYMVRELGMPKNHATELAAVRAAFGDVETVKSRRASKEVTTEKEPFMETHTAQRQKSTGKSFPDTLQAWEREGYERLIKNRVYKDWKEVEEERKWSPKAINQGRR